MTQFVDTVNTNYAAALPIQEYMHQLASRYYAGLTTSQILIIVISNIALYGLYRAVSDIIQYYEYKSNYVSDTKSTFNVAQAIDATEELKSQALKVQTTGPDGEVETQIIIQDVGLKETPRVAGQYASLARLQFGPMARTAANQLMVREYIVRQMTERHVRKVDQARIIPYAVAFSFLPDKEEINARKMMLDSEILYRQHVKDTPFWGIVNRRWYNPFGTRVTEPMVPVA